MALAFRSANQNADAASVASLTVGAPVGIVDDDILLFAVELAEQTDAISWPSGFALLSETNHDGGKTAIAWKRASGESGNYQATWTNNTRVCAIIYAVSGAETIGTPLTVGTWATGSGTTPDPPSADPGSSDDRLAVVFYGQEGKNNLRFSPPSGYTEPSNSDIGTTGSGGPTGHCGLGAAYRTYTGQAEDPGVATSTTSDGWAAQTIVFDAFAIKLVVAGLAVETDTALAATPSEVHVVGLAVETDTALDVSWLSDIPVGIATETDSALALTINRAYSVAGGFGGGWSDGWKAATLETDSALAMTAAEAYAVGLSTETDTAFIVRYVPEIGLAIETDTAFEVSTTLTGIVDIAIETDAGLLVARPLGVATEADTALSASAVETRVVGIATETDTALAFTAVRSYTIGISAEVDTGLVTGQATTVHVGIAEETGEHELCFSDSQLMTFFDGIVMCVAGTGALPVAVSQQMVLGLSSETDTALSVLIAKVMPVGLATETDQALAIPASIVVGIATEADTAFSSTAAEIHLVGLAAETDTTFALTMATRVPVGLASETDSTPDVMAVVTVPPVGLAVETDTALALTSAIVTGPRRPCFSVSSGARDMSVSSGACDLSAESGINVTAI